jgi:hypothetical protein
MTTNTVTMTSADHEEESRQGLIHEATKINTEGHDVLGAEHQVALAEAAIEDHEQRNPDLLKLHSKVVMRHLAFLFGLFCVYWLDVILFGATAEYAVGLVTDNLFLVFLGKYGVPLFILGIEVICSLMMLEARNETAKEEEEAPSHDE